LSVSLRSGEHRPVDVFHRDVRLIDRRGAVKETNEARAVELREHNPLCEIS
jgi:hypothetical protein